MLPGGFVGVGAARRRRFSLQEPLGRSLQFFWSLEETDSRVHRDETASLLLVAQGRKNVDLWRQRTVCNPEAGDGSQDQSAEEGDPDASLELPAGHALYLPRGLWHRVRSDPGTLAFSLRVQPASAARR